MGTRRVRGRGPIRSKAFVLYEGTKTAHRSCGIALAEAFGRSTTSYQSLRRGGVTGNGTCGAIVGGQLLLGEYLGDTNPTGKVTDALCAAMMEYERRIEAELDRGPSIDFICNNMTAPHGDFGGPARHSFCTHVVAQVAQLVDEVLRARGIAVRPTPISLDDGRLFDPVNTPDPEPPRGTGEWGPVD